MGSSETMLVEVRIERPSPPRLPDHSIKSKPLKNSMKTAGDLCFFFLVIHMRKERPKKAPLHTFLNGHRLH